MYNRKNMPCSSESSATSGQIPARVPVKYQEKASFTQKCSMFSQYLKENGSFGDLNIAMTPNAKSPISRPVTTMDLFPQHPCLSSPVAEEDLNSSTKPAIPEETTAQMTMYYGGEMFVFDDVSASKAKQIMAMARNETPQIHDICTDVASDHQSETGNPIREIQFMNPNFGNGSIRNKNIQTPPVPILWDLPITRRASLYRFLEKRKDRVAARAPYQTRDGPKNSTAENEMWFG